MALSAIQTAYFEKRLGTLSAEDVTDVETRLARLGGDGNEAAAAVEVLDIRLSNMLKNPAQFSIPGDYSENRTANIEQLRQTLAEAKNEAGAFGSVLVSVPPQPSRWAR